MTRTNARTGLTTAALFLAAGSATTPSLADTYGYFNSNDDCYMFVHGMPDFDQKRDVAPGILGLPVNDEGEGGAMFCMPTSATDLLGYVNKHGYPGVYGPGVQDFEGPSVAVYNSVTSVISQLGGLMGTDGNDGTTNGTLARSILQQILDVSAPGAFDVYRFSLQEDWAPKSTDMTLYALSGGAVMFCYGRWNMVNSAVLDSRDGGHCVALTRVDHRAFQPAFEGDIGFANPSNSSNTTTQAAFFQQNESIRNDLFALDGENIVMTRILFDVSDPEDERYRLIDSCYVIYPREGFTSSIGGNSLNFWGLHGGTGGGFTLNTYIPPDNHPIGSFAILPDRTHCAIQTASIGVLPGALYYVNLLTHETTHVAQAGQGRGCVFGDDRTLWVIDGHNVIGYNMDPAVEAGDYLIWQQGFGNLNPSALAYDDENDQLVVLFAQTSQLYRFPVRHRTLGNPTIYNIVGAQLNHLSVKMELSPADGSVWIGDLSDNSLTQYVEGRALELNRAARLAGGAQFSLGGFSVANDGRLYVGIDGGLKEFVLDNGQLMPSTTGPLSGMTVGDDLWITRGRHNTDPALNDGPDWYNIQPDEVEQGDESAFCRVDYAPPFGQLDFSDVVTYLGLFASGHPDADLAAPFGQFDFSDVVQFLIEFAAGCP
ncbi:MAG: GC-type dockerin domain-anchored protein [Phycisphaerales bacterium]